MSGLDLVALGCYHLYCHSENVMTSAAAHWGQEDGLIEVLIRIIVMVDWCGEGSCGRNLHCGVALGEEGQ